MHGPPFPPQFGFLWRRAAGPLDSACWEWKGIVRSTGYGVVRWRENGATRETTAHRFVWQALRGLVGDGVQLHHVCENKLCVNPSHLMPVASTEHKRLHLKSHCKRGHELVEANLYYDQGRRRCRACVLLKEAAKRERKRLAREAQS